MNRFIITAVFAATAAISASTIPTAASAAPGPQSKKGGGGGGVIQSAKKATTSSSTSFHLNNVHRNNFFPLYNGCYRPQTYCGWSSYCYYPQYCCYAYYCPVYCQWFYWCDALCRYVPVSYLSVYRPATIGIVQQGAFPVQTSPGVGLPPGATGVPAGGIQQMSLPKN